MRVYLTTIDIWFISSCEVLKISEVPDLDDLVMVDLWTSQQLGVNGTEASRFTIQHLQLMIHNQVTSAPGSTWFLAFHDVSCVDSEPFHGSAFCGPVDRC